MGGPRQRHRAHSDRARDGPRCGARGEWSDEMKAVALMVLLQVAGALDNIGIDQKMNEPVPLNLVFRDEAGKAVTLGQYFGEKPVILSLVYFKCPMLCT